MKNTKFFLFIFLSLLCFSCADDLEYDFPGEDVNKVYIKSNNFTVNGYDKSIAQLVKTPVGIYENGLQMQLPEVASTFAVDEDIVLKYVIDPSFVENYNAANNTDYKTFPKEWVTFENNEIIIHKNTTRGESNVAFVTDDEHIVEMEDGDYLLPIRLEKISGNAILSENRNVHYFVVNVYQDDNIPDIEIPSTGELLMEDRTEWKVECFNSSFVAEDLSALFDNDEKRSLSYNLGQEDGDKGFIIDMNKEYSNISGIYQVCSSISFLLSSVDLYTSIDKKSWELQGNYKAVDAKKTVSFYQPINARYLKFVVKEASRWGAYLNEINVYVKK